MPRRVVEGNENDLNNKAEAGTNAKNPHTLAEEASQRNALAPGRVYLRNLFSWSLRT